MDVGEMVQEISDMVTGMVGEMNMMVVVLQNQL